jgi:hypothetical protein
MQNDTRSSFPHFLRGVWKGVVSRDTHYSHVFPASCIYQPPDYRAACVTLVSPHQFCHPPKQKQHKHHHSVRTICLLLQSLIHFFIPLFPPSHGKYFRAPQRLPAPAHPPAYILDLPAVPISIPPDSRRQHIGLPNGRGRRRGLCGLIDARRLLLRLPRFCDSRIHAVRQA